MTALIPADSALVKRSAGSWLYGPATDLLIGCGAWSLPMLWLAGAASQHSAGLVAPAFYLLALFCNNPHYMATVHRAYGTPRETAKYRVFTVWVTALLLLAVGGLYLKPSLLPLVFTAYILWSPWHYTGQNFGVAMMMTRRNDVQPTPFERNLIYLFFAASFALWAVDFNAAGSEDPRILTFHIPPALARPVDGALIAVMLAGGSWGMARLVARSGARRMAAPLTILATQMIWFMAPVVLRATAGVSVSPLFYSTGMLAFMHCAQYLWVTSYYARREAESAGHRRWGPPCEGTRPSGEDWEAESGGKRKWSFGRYYFALVTGGVALFLPGPWVASLLFHQDLVQGLFIFIALVNLHHFILDGVIWKLRDGAIARLLLRGGEAGGPTGMKPEFQGSDGTSPYRMGWEPLPTPAGRPAVPVGGRKWLYGLAAVLLILAALDQLQNFLTLDQTTLPRLRAAERANGRDTRVYFQRARILAARGETATALRELDRAIAINPYNLPPQSFKGELLARLGRPGEAFEQFDRLASLFKPMSPILINAGVFAVRSGRAKEAVPEYERALELDSEDAGARLGLAEALQLAGRSEQAARQYSIYIAAANQRAGPPDPRLPLAEMKLAEVCLAMKLPDKAVWWYRAATAQAEQTGQPALARQSRDRLALLLGPAKPQTVTRRP